MRLRRSQSSLRVPRTNGHREALRQRPRGIVLGAILAAVALSAARPSPAAADPTPLLAGAASLVLPGGGQFVNGQPGKGLLFLGGTAGTALLALVTSLDWTDDSNHAGTLGVVALGIWTWSVADAALVAAHHRREEKRGAALSQHLDGDVGLQLGVGLVRPRSPGMLLRAHF